MGVSNNENLLEINGLVKSFGALQAVDHLSFHVRKGQIKSVIGPNGAGKTTLFNIISGLIRPDSGQVIFKSKDITHQSPHRIAQKGIARSFQLVSIFPKLNLFDNLRVALQSQSRGFRRFLPIYDQKRMAEEISRILENVNLLEKKDLMAAEISHGEQKHLEIGMTLAMKPDLMLLDEPTAGMTPSESNETVRLIKRISQDLTVLIVEHDMLVVQQISDEVLVMHYGSKLAEGNPEKVLKSKEVVDAYFGG